MDFTVDAPDPNIVFTLIMEKFSNLTLFWSRIRLTLPIRITVAKTSLMPELNFWMLAQTLSPIDANK
jgi:hypothetical protein